MSIAALSPRGRPRNAALDRVIMRSTLALFVEKGFDAMSVEGVAARAGVGKTTIYRRWPSKEAFLIAALTSLDVANPIPDTGSTRDDLLVLARAALQPQAIEFLAGFLPRLLAEGMSNPKFVDLYFQRVLRPRMA